MSGAISQLPNTSSWRGAYLSTGTASLPLLFKYLSWLGIPGATAVKW